MSDPLVTTAWLAERLGRDDVQVLDGSWWMPAEGREPRAEYLEAHIPGAVFFDIDAIADHSVDLPHMLPTPAAFADAIGKLGLRRDATIVAYDTYGVRAAARVWWTLRTMGFDKVVVLDGGLRVWRAEGRPLESGEVALPPSVVIPAFRPELVRDLDAVAAIIKAGSATIVDARGAARFRAEAPEPRPGLRSGHMPGARNVPMDTLLDADGRLKSPDDLKALFQSAGVDMAGPIVTTCGSGLTAAVLALALARLGRTDVAVYDGSWTEWGGRPDVPVLSGP